MKKIAFFIPLVCFLACTPDSSQRPGDVWVFRSVLDEKPRMLTAGLDKALWISYDVQKAVLYKAWKGGVILEGAVYTSAHGPQPKSKGPAYFEMSDDTWVLKREQETISPVVEYRGHAIAGDQLELRFDLITPDGDVISVKELPQYVSKGDKNGLRRQFEIENSTSYTPALKTSLGILQNDADFTTDGIMAIESNPEMEKDGIGYVLPAVELALNKNSVHLDVYYHPRVDLLNTPEEEEEAQTQGAQKGAELIAGSDCQACHNEEVKTVGPAYLTIAKKYNDDDATIELLSERIIVGGSGIWGIAPMTPHPDLMKEDANEMVRYILSLDDDVSTPFDKFALGMKSIPVRLDNDFDVPGGAGFMTHLYYNPEGLDFIQATEETPPVKQDVVKQIHTLDASDFTDLQEDFVLEYQGILDIPSDGSYDFRLISDDGSYLFIDGQQVIDNGGYHGPVIRDGEMYLSAGPHPIRIVFGQGKGGAMISLQWFDKETEQFVLLDHQSITYSADITKEVVAMQLNEEAQLQTPGDAAPLVDVHPAFDLFQARPGSFKPRVGGIGFLDDGRMVVCTWDSIGGVYLVDNWQSAKPAQMKVKRIAFGLAEPLGLTVVDNEIYVLQKQELTRLVDVDGDDLIEEYQTVSDDWRVSANFHEFSFGLEYQDGFFYGALATAILPGGASADPQIPDRGKVVKIEKETGKTELIAHGLRTPNGIGIGIDDQLFIADNQGDWLPASKIVHVREGAFYGSRSVDFEGTASLRETLPVVWLPQDEIGNSPSTPLEMRAGPYAGQMIHGEVTNGGIKRVFVEKIKGQYQGALFRFSQGFEAGVNRILWAPDGSLMVGGVGSTGNWSHSGKGWFGLQRLVYNGKQAFEMLEVRAKPDGFEIEMTEPLEDNASILPGAVEVQQWRYQPTADYGGPKLNLEILPVRSLALSEDRKSVRLEIEGLEDGHVVYLRIKSPWRSRSGSALWSTECWYTLNEIPSKEASIDSPTL